MTGGVKNRLVVLAVPAVEMALTHSARFQPGLSQDQLQLTDEVGGDVASSLLFTPSAISVAIFSPRVTLNDGHDGIPTHTLARHYFDKILPRLFFLKRVA
ncbi:hypothetical protein SAMN05216315_10367 [Nitrosospira sp. Nsp18]|uniref:hypothetical protein n=1 Tax=Nitrosospira sp. Nsp18 TaxID=1855334 RepID=UPI0008806493|nr:hypothetical protein [Nitrosospira sp. Nsp18]SDA12215.1 hypothetical protein SAMN05216315_10367 [Nitrosospira sp. Nsp18]